MNKYISIIFYLLIGFDVFADVPPPTVPPVTPPGLSMSESLLMLLVFALLFGFYKIYSSILKKKSSN